MALGRTAALLALALLAGCDAGDSECNAWLNREHAELRLQPGTAAYESCMAAAQHRVELFHDARARGHGP